MMNGGDAAEQVMRMSLEGMEVAVRISGEGAKYLAVVLAAALREEHKTKGKTRLNNLIRSGKELKVFSLQNRDLEKFTMEAKRYGVLYCALKDSENRSDNASVDIIARAEDAPKIQRIIERYEFASVDRAKVYAEIEREQSVKRAKENIKITPEKGRTEKNHLSEKNLKVQKQSEEDISEKVSVKKRLMNFTKASKSINFQKPMER